MAIPGAIRAYLKSRGYHRRGYFYTRPINSDFSASVIFATALRGTMISPKLGIVSYEVNAVIESMKGPLKDGLGRVLCVDLLSLTDENKLGYYKPDGRDIRRIPEDLETYGEAWFCKPWSLAQVMAEFENTNASSDFWAGAALFAMVGDKTRFSLFEDVQKHDQFLQRLKRAYGL